MIINFKQTEIEQALRAYVVAQGISLYGRDLTISFTAGRRESGISAEISIDDVEIPGFTNDVYVAEVPVGAKAAVLSVAPAVVAEAPAAEANEAAEVQVADAAELNEPVPEVPQIVESKPTVSLFG